MCNPPPVTVTSRVHFEDRTANALRFPVVQYVTPQPPQTVTSRVAVLRLRHIGHQAVTSSDVCAVTVRTRPTQSMYPRRERRYHVKSVGGMCKLRLPCCTLGCVRLGCRLRRSYHRPLIMTECGSCLSICPHYRKLYFPIYQPVRFHCRAAVFTARYELYL